MPSDPSIEGLLIGADPMAALNARLADLEREVGQLRRTAMGTVPTPGVPTAAAAPGATAVTASGSRFCWYVNGLWRSTPPA